MEEEVRVVKSATCDSLSGKSKLNYEFGARDGKDLQFRIVRNSGGGMFFKDWIAMEDVFAVLNSPLVQKAISATAFKEVFAGKSINTQSFLMAVLRNEGVIGPHAEKPRAYQVINADEFRDRIQLLMEVGLVPEQEAVTGAGVAAKKTVSKAKTKKSG